MSAPPQQRRLSISRLKAEKSLADALNQKDLDWELQPGEGAFYGPKIDFDVADALGRAWQLATIQLDFQMPERFDLTYVGEDGEMHTPVMIHRAPFGSLERFTGMLIEHFAGAFPLWLAAEQARVLTVSEKSEEYGRRVEAQFRAAGLRANGDYRGQKLGAKIRDSQLEKIPYTAVVGPKDEAAGTVSLRDRVDGSQNTLPLEDAVQLVNDGKITDAMSVAAILRVSALRRASSR